MSSHWKVLPPIDISPIPRSHWLLKRRIWSIISNKQVFERCSWIGSVTHTIEPERLLEIGSDVDVYGMHSIPREITDIVTEPPVVIERHYVEGCMVLYLMDIHKTMPGKVVFIVPTILNWAPAYRWSNLLVTDSMKWDSRVKTLTCFPALSFRGLCDSKVCHLN